MNGVGANNRADIEQAFYQAFTYHLLPYAEMQDARYWTIERAPTTAARAAISDAWDAVGLHGDQDVSVHWLAVDVGNTEKCSVGSVAMEIKILNESPRTFNVSSLFFDQHAAAENRCQWQPKTAHFGEIHLGRSGRSPVDARRACWAGRRERSDRSPGQHAPRSCAAGGHVATPSRCCSDAARSQC